jgi:hypothetical protein
VYSRLVYEKLLLSAIRKIHKYMIFKKKIFYKGCKGSKKGTNINSMIFQMRKSHKGLPTNEIKKDWKFTTKF